MLARLLDGLAGEGFDGAPLGRAVRDRSASRGSPDLPPPPDDLPSLDPAPPNDDPLRYDEMGGE